MRIKPFTIRIEIRITQCDVWIYLHSKDISTVLLLCSKVMAHVHTVDVMHTSIQACFLYFSTLHLYPMTHIMMTWHTVIVHTYLVVGVRSSFHHLKILSVIFSAGSRAAVHLWYHIVLYVLVK